jgi:hypothetical protein
MSWKHAWRQQCDGYIKSGKKYAYTNMYDEPKYALNHSTVMKHCRLLNMIKGFELTDYQLELHRVLFPYTIKHHFDEYWADEGPKIMRLYNISYDDIKQHQILNLTARRNGKTHFNKTEVVAQALSVSTKHGFQFKIAMPAHREKTSRDTIREVKEWLRTFPGFPASQFDTSQEWIILEEQVDRIVFRRNDGGSGFVEIRGFAGDKVRHKGK